MKLSDFRVKSSAKKLQYIDGEPVIVENDKLNGDINFYTLDEVVLDKINKEVLTNINILDIEKDEVFMYKLLPYLCDVEVDISVEEFEELFQFTNKNFIKFIEVIMSIFNDTFSMADSIKNIQETAKNITEKTNVVVETDEDKLNRLYDEIDSAINRNEKRRLMRQINELEQKLNING